MKKPLDGWVTLTGCGLATIYAIGLAFEWIKQNPSVEMFIFSMIAFGIGRKADRAARAVESSTPKTEDDESFEDRLRRNQR